MAVHEGKWRCPYCSAVNRGRDLKCEGCGATRDEDVAFFLEADAPEVREEALLKTARAGADWLCQFCSTANRPDYVRCAQCGAEKGVSPSRPVREMPDPPPPPEPRREGCGRRLLGCLTLVLLALGVFLYFAFRKNLESVEVAGFEWRRGIEVEAWTTVREEAWEGSVPLGARTVGSRREVRRTERERVATERVRVGTRDMGNGFFEDVYEDRPIYNDRPVYGTKYVYEIQRWVPARTATAEGRDQSPQWPEPELGAGEREGRRSEAYWVLLQGRREYRKQLPHERWAALRAGQRLMATVRGGHSVEQLQ